MPLSEDEQRILSEIEEQLYETDPALAREVGSTTVYTHAVRSMKWAGVLFVVGVLAMIFTLSTSYLMSFGGFVVMLASALWFERNLRRLGRVGLQQITQNMRGGGMRGMLGQTGERMRDRLRKDKEEGE